MATNRWSAEHDVAEHKDLQTSAMAVDHSGDFALLAGRKYFAVIHLDRPTEVCKLLSRQSKWEISTAEWNPHSSHGHLLAVACNQKAELLSWKENQLTTLQTLRAHTRVIGDLNWSPFDTNLLATCSVDNYTYIWDIRDGRKPASSLFSIAGASQVKWNKVTNTLIATANEGDVRLWDYRRSTTPLLYLAAHTKKILGLDWSPSQECQLATASQECTVKFWDVSNQRRPENVNLINSALPVWRARYTPFGDGLITVMIPQLRRGDNSLFLWNIGNLASPVHTFVGHTDVVTDFGWRQEREDRNYQLVTWAKDHCLRIWYIDPQLQKLCGHDADITDTSDQDVGVVSDPSDNLESSQNMPLEPLDLGIANAPFSTEKSDLISPAPLPKTLQEEFTLVNINIPCVTVDEMDALKRSCTVSVVSGRCLVKLEMSFPESYPCGSVPTFHFRKLTNVDPAIRAELLKALRTTSQQHVKRNRNCLEPCLRQLKSTLNSCLMKRQIESPVDLSGAFGGEPVPGPFIPVTNVYGSFQDVTVPFPRTSGARFCGAGYLVSFSRPIYLKRLSNPGEVTPRSLSALVAYASNPIHSTQASLFSAAQSPSAETGVSVSSYYYLDRKHRTRGKDVKDDDPNRVESKAGLVVIYDVTSLLPVHRGLAETYVINPKNIPEMCAKNASAAAAAGRKDLLQLWSMIVVIANPLLNGNLDVDTDSPWIQHPFGRKLLQSVMNHYTAMGDIQTVAMLCCMFVPNFPEKSPIPKKSTSRIADTAVYTHISGKRWLKPGGSPYHTIHPGDTSLDGWNFVLLKTSRSSSWSDSLDDHDFRYSGNIYLEPRDNDKEELKRANMNMQFLDSSQLAQYERYKKAYAEILYNWNLLQSRAQVLKHVKSISEPDKGIGSIAQCHSCKKDVKGPYCHHCKNYSLKCVVCHGPVKGAANFCIWCGHGGHVLHMQNWFIDNDSCPAGCGCVCLDQFDLYN